MICMEHTILVVLVLAILSLVAVEGMRWRNAYILMLGVFGALMLILAEVIK
jgi:hypothetical protein